MQQEQQALQKEFVHLGEEIQKLANTRQQLMIQLNENEGVRTELALLSGNAELFRAVGSALVKTETSDARALVDGRVEMIKKELGKTEQLVEEKVSSSICNLDRGCGYTHVIHMWESYRVKGVWRFNRNCRKFNRKICSKCRKHQREAPL